MVGVMSEHDPTEGAPEGELALEEAPKTKKPRRYKVMLHNDDYTSMEFVVHVLVRFFRKDQSEATFLMLTVHQKGLAVVGVYPKDQAETKVSVVTKFARENGQPLLVTLEAE